jgi:antitoxin component YwqK of YwqJK toxin-antitoxin module
VTYKLLAPIILIILGLSFTTAQAIAQECAPTKRTDWELNDLEGRVKTISTFKAWYPEGSKKTPSKFELEEKVKYDRAGNQLVWENVNYLPLDPADKLTSLFTCDSNNRIIEIKTVRADKSLLKRTTYRYDAKGNEAEMAHYFPDGILERKEEYIYDQKGNIIEQRDTQQSHPEHFIPKRYDVYIKTKVTCKYDDKNNKIEEKHFYPDGSLFGTWTYKYDLQDRLIKETRFDKQGRLEDQDIYLYSKNGLLREKLEYMNFCYKRDGTMCEGDIHTAKGTFYYATRTVYEYDRRGNWIRETEFSIKDGNKRLRYELSTVMYRRILYY